MSTLKVDTILKRTGTGTITLGQSGDTISIPSGATITNSGTNGGGFGISEIVTPYAARLYKGSTQSIANDTWTAYDFASGTANFNKGSVGDLSNGRITVPSGAAGLWCFYFMFRVNNFRANRTHTTLFKNGSSIAGTSGADNFEMGYWGASSQYSSVGGALVLDLAEGDYIVPYAKQNSGGADSIQDKSFTGWYLGASS
jgi:hypothetical protein